MPHNFFSLPLNSEEIPQNWAEHTGKASADPNLDFLAQIKLGFLIHFLLLVQHGQKGSCL